MRKGTVLLLLCVCFGTPVLAQAQPLSPTKDRPTAAASARQFVQDFYDWYVIEAYGDQPGPAWKLALKERSALFSANVSRAAGADLDFDPFISRRDLCDRFIADRVVRRGSTYRVDVRAKCGVEDHAGPEVVAELTLKNAQWVFVDFHYARRADLSQVLKVVRPGDTRSSLTRCLDSAVDPLQTRMCAGLEASRLEAMLEDVYGQAMAALGNNPEAAEKVSAFEAAWAVSRDAEVSAAYPGGGRHVEDGSIAPTEVSVLRARLAAQQITALRELLRQSRDQAESRVTASR